VLELAADGDPFRGRASGEVALPAQPGHDAERPVRGVLAGLVESPQSLGEDRFQGVDSRLSDSDQRLAELDVVRMVEPVGPAFDQSLGFGDRRSIVYAWRGHAFIVGDCRDSCLSITQRSTAMTRRRRPGRPAA